MSDRGSSPVMIMVAPNGGRRSKRDHHAIPITPEEVAWDALRCKDAGACALHLHVRAEDGSHSLDPARYNNAIDLVRTRVGDGLVIQITTEAMGLFSPDQQMLTVRQVKPKWVSIAIREIVPDRNSEGAAEAFLGWLKDAGVVPQIILYDDSDFHYLCDLIGRGIVPAERPFLLFVLGRYAKGQQSEPGDLKPFLDCLGDARWPWAMCAFGRRELDCAEAAIEAGGHVRVGFENNVYRPDGSQAEDNAESVARVAETAIRLGRRPMTAGEVLPFLASTWGG